jgi:hypothetical protein
MFRALLAHPQESLHKAALGILRACYVSWLHQVWGGTPTLVQPTDIHLSLCTKLHVVTAQTGVISNNGDNASYQLSLLYVFLVH